ncbi:MAG TPA: hypothetical protein VFK97_03125 [Candidatus Saccharimonadales bacterium]|nr:hypothetical protein [Candidatus Saccharimonadales bacterium]
MAQRGLMIVLEGSDGSGKTTQFKLLAERLKAAGYEVSSFDFPRYDKDSSHFVRQYLSGAYGPAGEISPYTASLFYALDRYEAAVDIRKEIEAGKIVLVDRYVGSNMAHQGAKFTDPVEQRGFFVWADNLEFQLLDIPRPDVNLYLRVPASVSAKLISQRSAETGVKRDEHEKNSQHLKKSVATYDLLCQLFPKDFSAIECTKDGKLLGIVQISDLIWNKIKPLLPPEPPHSGRAAVITLGQMNSAAPAPTSQTIGRDKLIHKFKDTSLLLKLAVERQISTVEPTGFSIWADNRYKFYTPMGLSKNLEQEYKAVLTKLGELHKSMSDQLEVYYGRNPQASDKPIPNLSSVLLPVTPMAALCDFKAVFSPRSVERLAGQLLASDSPELQWTAQQIYLAARQIWPHNFKQPLESSGDPEPINNVINRLAEDKLSLNSGDRDSVKLLEASPRQEFDLLAESIYPYSSLSLAEISQEVSDWSYQQKYDSLKSAVHDPTVAAKLHYKFDVVSDQLTLSECINAALLSAIQVQVPSPRFGYEVPALVEEAGIEEMYMECFDESLKLFSALQRADRDDLTVYSTLLGHKLRWQFQANAGNLKTLFEHRGSDGFSQLVDALKEAVAEVHPLTWAVLSAGGQPAAPPKPRQNRVKPTKRRKPAPRRSGKPKKS